MRLRFWGIAILGGAWWLSSGDPARVPLDLQAAATTDGFAILERHSARVFETDLKGAPTGDRQPPKLSDDTRVIGTRMGPALVWKEGKKIAIAPIDRTDTREVFGRRVERMCAQTASSHLGFGIAWIESDGDLWFVHGPTTTSAEVMRVGAMREQDPNEDDENDQAVAPAYCGIARADAELAMMWRNGNRAELVRCGKRCAPPRKVSIDNNATILAFGCTRRACLMATRDRAGATTLHWLNENAKTVAKQTLSEACKDTRVEIDGEGERFAIAYSNGPEPIVDFAEAPGKLRRVFFGGDPNTVPALTWAWNTLMIASQRNGWLVWTTKAL